MCPTLSPTWTSSCSSQVNAKRKELRRIIEQGIKPTIIDHYEREAFPQVFIAVAKEIDRSVAQLRTDPSSGWTSMLAVAYEAERVDLSLVLFYFIETLELFGSDEHKQLLPSLRSYDKIGSWNCLGDKSKVDPQVASLAPVEGSYRLNGRVAWALNANISDVIVLFTKHVETGKVIGVLLDSKAVGLTASAISTSTPSALPTCTSTMYS
jgi:alkylation response protein AidB-like acyl-CoA dehydrogenase